MIDTVKGTIAISPDKLEQINVTVHQWLGKSVVSKCQLQSILSLLLYVHECVISLGGVQASQVSVLLQGSSIVCMYFNKNLGYQSNKVTLHNSGVPRTPAWSSQQP